MDYSIPTTVPPPSNNDWFNSATYHDMRSVVNATYEIPYPSTVTLKYTNFGTSSDQIETIDAGSVHDDKGSSSTSDSMSPDTILMPMVKRGRPTENPCWSYFHRIDDQLVRCRICTKLVKSACATNMTKHLERHHSDDYEKLAEQIRLYRINDASFRTKIQYLTHMNPPEDDATSYLIPKEEFTTVPQTYSTPATTVPQNYTEYFDPSTSTDTNWQLSHFWDQPQHQAPITVLHPPPPTVIQSTSTVPSVPTVLPTVPILATVPAAKRPWNGAGAVGGGGERPYMKRNRKTEHPVWEYFKRTGDGNAECTICGGVVKSPCSSNFMRHLMRHHTPEYNDVYMKWVQKRNQTGGGPPTQQM
ncbi:unnamed protein product [Caenorhabditis angaria]|uniref:BED-type domain-containing protein n=1 Tax=Caenorhabditis angaria TaxID=860376 RepID=A0A9P1IL47_9PELO|nr:unnamed protein product [Caenorhabditis angaria]